MTKAAEKTIPFGAAHTYIAHREHYNTPQTDLQLQSYHRQIKVIIDRISHHTHKKI